MDLLLVGAGHKERGSVDVVGQQDGSEGTPGAAEPEARGSAILLLRREQLLLEPPADQPVSGHDLADRGLPVRVVRVRSAGPRQVAVVGPWPVPARRAPDVTALRVEVELPMGQEVSPGQRLTLRLDPRHPTWVVPDPDALEWRVDPRGLPGHPTPAP